MRTNEKRILINDVFANSQSVSHRRAEFASDDAREQLLHTAGVSEAISAHSANRAAVLTYSSDEWHDLGGEG